jgi:hypothetical protein
MSVIHKIGQWRLPLTAASAAVSVAALAGCYAYVAPNPGSSIAGKEAQLWLSDSGAVVLASAIGPAAAAVTGRIVADSADSYVVSLSTVRRRDGDETAWRGERVSIGRPLVIDAGTRRFSLSRTALFGGLVSATLLAARQAFQGHGTGGGGGGVGHSGAQ